MKTLTKEQFLKVVKVIEVNSKLSKKLLMFKVTEFIHDTYDIDKADSDRIANNVVSKFFDIKKAS